MSAEQKYTERDLVLAKREAYVMCRSLHGYVDGFARTLYEKEAVSKYPLPKVTRPRVVKDPESDTNGFWMVKGGRVQWTCFRNGDGTIDLNWRDARPELVAVTPARVALWYDLLDNPTEEVEDA